MPDLFGSCGLPCGASAEGKAELKAGGELRHSEADGKSEEEERVK